MRKYTITIEAHVSEEALAEKLAALKTAAPQTAELSEEECDLININGFLGGTVSALNNFHGDREIVFVPGEDFSIGSPEDEDFYISVKVTQ